MTQLGGRTLERALDALPTNFPGPGGAAGVVKDGVIIEARVWGFANLSTRAQMTQATRLPLCSVSKQFTCGVMLDRIADPSSLDQRVGSLLPAFTGPLPTVAQLCNNQSGLRDHWALTVLDGADAEGVFHPEDASRIMDKMKTGHFKPGMQYSYCNTNFRMIAELLEEATSQPMGALYHTSMFSPAGMETATLTADTSNSVDGVAGYEGSAATGYFTAVNRIYWYGDAGISASLADMLAWECHIDRTRDDADALYQRLAAPQRFADGTPAAYGNGLAHTVIGGRQVTGHGGALRGFRVQRFHAAQERLSVVVMFNHEGSAHDAATNLILAACGLEVPQTPIPAKGWNGTWLEHDSELLLRVEADALGLSAHFAVGPDVLVAEDDRVARSAKMTLTRANEGLWIDRPLDNLRGMALPISGTATQDISGHYTSDETESDLQIINAGGAFFAGFGGFLGQSPMVSMDPVAEDTWIIATRRSMDAPAPGDWTVRFRRGPNGKITGATVGCWLARKIPYRKLA